jgi:hypothetical protein
VLRADQGKGLKGVYVMLSARPRLHCCEHSRARPTPGGQMLP